MPNQTGPTSAAGKAVSSANATIHNGCSEKLIVEGERLEDYQKLVASLAGHYQPADPSEQTLVEDLAHDRWILWRRRRAFNNVEADVYALQPNEAKWTEAEFKRIALADRYKTTAERSFNRSLKNVEAFAKERVNAYRWEATHDLAIKRLELAKRKHELESSKAAMRAKSATGAVARRQDEEEIAIPLGGPLETATVLRESSQKPLQAPEPPIRSAKSAVFSPVAPAKTWSSPLNITQMNPLKGGRIA